MYINSDRLYVLYSYLSLKLYALSESHSKKIVSFRWPLLSTLRASRLPTQQETLQRPPQVPESEEKLAELEKCKLQIGERVLEMKLEKLESGKNEL